MRLSKMVREAKQQMRTASDSFFWYAVPQKEFFAIEKKIKEKDEQSGDLFNEVCQHLSEKLRLSGGENEAMSRVMGIMRNYKTAAPELLRNEVFKSAHSLGMQLPSHMF